MLKKLIVITVTLVALSGSAYEFSSGGVFMRSVMGPIVNAARFDRIAREATPLGGFMVGLEGEWVVTRPWALVGAFRPTFSAGAVDVGFGFGVRYRWDDLGSAPVIINASLQLTPSLLVPFGAPRNHVNLGLRHSVGVDYFLMHNLVVGAECALDPSWLMTEEIKSFELSVEILASLMLKL